MLKKIHYNTSLKYKLIIAFSALILIPILFLGITSYTISRNYMINEANDKVSQTMTQLNIIMDNYFVIYLNKCEIFVNSIPLQRQLKQKNTNINDQIKNHNEISNILAQVLMDIEYNAIKNTYYFNTHIKIEIYALNPTLSMDGDTMFPYDEIKNESWNPNIGINGSYNSWQSNVVPRNGREKDAAIAISMRLIDFDTSQELGVIRLYIPEVRIQNLMNQNIQNPENTLLYVDQQGHVMASSGPNVKTALAYIQEGKELKEGVNEIEIAQKKYIAGYKLSAVTGWKLIYFTPIDSITQKIMIIRNISIIIIFVSILLCIIIATVISSYFSKRLKMLIRKTNQVKSGNFDISRRIEGNDEIWQLERDFYEMVQRIEHLIKTDYKSKIVLNQLRLELLQEQINPHLLYNALSMMGYIAKKREQNEIYHATQHLISFYKGILNKGKITSSLLAEMNMVKSYIEIMKFIYVLDIDATFEIEENILEHYSVKLFLQPIIENALLHGLKPKHGGTIIIWAQQTENKIEFVVSDNGVGIPLNMLESIKKSLIHFEEAKGYGLGNVNKRIQLFFGPAFGIRIESEEGVGTTVFVSIPCLTEAQMKELMLSLYLI